MENGKLLGVMAVSVDIDFINRLNKRMEAGNRSAFTVTDDSGRIIFNNNYNLIGKPFRTLFRCVRKNLPQVPAGRLSV